MSSYDADWDLVPSCNTTNTWCTPEPIALWGISHVVSFGPILKKHFTEVFFDLDLQEMTLSPLSLRQLSSGRLRVPPLCFDQLPVPTHTYSLRGHCSHIGWRGCFLPSNPGLLPPDPAPSFLEDSWVVSHPADSASLFFFFTVLQTSYVSLRCFQRWNLEVGGCVSNGINTQWSLNPRLEFGQVGGDAVVRWGLQASCEAGQLSSGPCRDRGILQGCGTWNQKGLA